VVVVLVVAVVEKRVVLVSVGFVVGDSVVIGVEVLPVTHLT
jgi:hypothetical protein